MLASGDDINRMRQKLALVSCNGRKASDPNLMRTIQAVILGDRRVLPHQKPGSATDLVSKVLVGIRRMASNPIASPDGRTIPQFNRIKVNGDRKMVDSSFFAHPKVGGINPSKAYSCRRIDLVSKCSLKQQALQTPWKKENDELNYDRFRVLP